MLIKKNDYLCTMNYELIEDTTLEAITKKLNDLLPGWAQTIATKITADKHWKIYSNKPCSYQIVNNIGTCKVQSQLHRRLFVKYANEIIEPTIVLQKEATKTAKKIA